MAKLTDLIMPDPQVFPKCSGCGTAYVLRRGMVVEEKKWVMAWAWFRDCGKECKRTKPAPEAVLEDLRKKKRRKKAS